MGTIVFIAVQCCQCSTMQVKQQKKSSSKWTCVVCNQKQSVRRVFAQGFIAKDLRKFVQSFNMSPHSYSQTLGSGNAFCQDDLDIKAPNSKPKRSDWSEYVDIKEEEEEQQQQQQEVMQGDGEMRIVTELPKEMFKKPTLKDSSSSSFQLCSQENKHNLYGPLFSKRQKTSNATYSGKSRKCQLGSLGKSTWVDNNEKDDIQPNNPQITATTRASRWHCYMDQEENDLQFESEKSFSNVTGQCCNGPMSNHVDDEKVEEDIHPDFL